MKSIALIVLAAAMAAPALGADGQIIVTSGDLPDDRREGIRPEGLVLELGAVSPTHGDHGFLFGVQAGMGTLLSRHLDFSVGLRHWSADIDRSEFGVDTPGTFNATSLDAVLAYPLLRVKGLRPYVATGVAGHVVGADIPGDPSLADALDGTKLGMLAAVGIGTTRSGLGVRLQARRDFVEDVQGWSYTLGIGWWPKTRASRSNHDAYSAGRRTSVPVATEAKYPSARPVAEPKAEPGTVTPSTAELVRALNHLKAQNEDLATELADLKRQVDEEARVVVAAPPAAPAVEDEADRLFASLSAVTGPQALRRDGHRGLLTLDQSILFASGESTLTVMAREHLRRIGLVLLRHPRAAVEVQGHTDAIGNPANNMKLSDLRARAVRNELLAVGVSPLALAVVAYGDTRPVAPNDTPEGRARNRRVDLYVTASDLRTNQ